MTTSEFITLYNLKSLEDLSSAIKQYGSKLPVSLVYKAAEYLNPNRDTTAAYYTDEMICEHIMNELPEFEGKNHIAVLEPSAGAGIFIPYIAEKYKEKAILEIYLVDIDKEELKIAELIFNTYFREKYLNVAIIYINDNYLQYPIWGKKFDLVIGNPPYAKVKTLALIKNYRKNSLIKKSTNLFVWFLEKALRDGVWVSLIVPKSILNAPEYSEIRSIINDKTIVSIIDFGEYGFKGVKIETVNLLITSDLLDTKTHINSITQGINIFQEQQYITDNKYPYWLLYRNEDFDKFADSLMLGVFEAYRDRQIVNSMTKGQGQYRVLKSRNIGSNFIIDILGYDSYIDNIDSLHIAKFLNRDKVVLVPNLSYYPRASFLPKNTIANGSVALLTLKDPNIVLTSKDLALFSTKEFTQFYRIARNYGTRSLNIDNNSVYFFGIRR